MIDERCGKPKSLEGASEGLIADPLFLAMMTISFLTLGRPQRLATYSKDDDDDNSSSTLLSGQTPTPPSHLDELRQICQEYYNTMWKVESEKYDEEFELMKKEFEVAYTQTWSYDSTPPSPPTSLESPSPLAIASAEPVSELSAPFWLFRKT